ncbi:MAG: hypothetical protein NWR72_17385 [Bacteroidia bacterium]|nr:hypothetical protein [Bacteroidia bacterium]
METNESPFDEFVSLPISKNAKDFLEQAAYWARFLAIVGFIGLGLAVVAALFLLFGSSYMGGMGVGMGLLYLVFIGIYAIPTYYLFQFAKFGKDSVDLGDSESFEESLRFLKATFRFFGIMTIIILSLYGLILVVGLFGLAGNIL